MSYTKRRPHLHSRRQTLQLSMDTQPIDLWFPPADEPIIIDNFTSAASVALCLTDAPIEGEALVLMDGHRQVTAILFDPPPGAAIFPGMIEGPGFEVEFCTTMFVLLVDHSLDGEPPPRLRRWYENLRRVHAVQGLYLLDIIEANGDDVRSVSIAVDRNSVWFEDFSPMPVWLDEEHHVCADGAHAGHDGAHDTGHHKPGENGHGKPGVNGHQRPGEQGHQKPGEQDHEAA